MVVAEVDVAELDVAELDVAAFTNGELLLVGVNGDFCCGGLVVSGVALCIAFDSAKFS